MTGRWEEGSVAKDVQVRLLAMEENKAAKHMREEKRLQEI
jgi:hypothetical protein